jgi:hypothetical protein
MNLHHFCVSKKPEEHRLVGVEDDLSGADVAAELAAMRARAERTRRRLQMNTALPLPVEAGAPDKEESAGGGGGGH